MAGKMFWNFINPVRSCLPACGEILSVWGDRMCERRGERRRPVARKASVLLGDRASVNCTIRDLSPGGARLEFDGPTQLPDDFRLRIASADLIIPATAAWQSGREAGIRFTGVGSAGPVDNSPRRMVRSAA